MSDAGIIVVDSTTRTFTTNSGNARPSGGIVSIVGDSNISTSGSGNVITINGLTTLTSQTTTYTATASDYFINCTANSFTVTLPLASTVSGKLLAIKNSGTGTITLDGNGSETIDGETTQELIEDESMTLICDGSNWFII